MFAVVQVRGVVKTRRDIKDTLAMLRLHHINHCVVVPDTPEYLGMIRKVKDFVAYGEVDAESLGTVLSTRGRLVGNRPLTDEYVKANSKFGAIAELADAIAKGEASLRDINNKTLRFGFGAFHSGIEVLDKEISYGVLTGAITSLFEQCI